MNCGTTSCRRAFAADELFDDVVDDRSCHPVVGHFEYVRLPSDELKARGT